MREQGASDEELRSTAERAEAFYLSTRAEPDLEQPQPHEALVPGGDPSERQAASAAFPVPNPQTAADGPSLVTPYGLTDPSVASATQSGPATAATDDTPPYPPTFAELAHLIATGAPVPGIRDIPDRLADDEPSESRAEPMKKPWERDIASVQVETENP
ncbi:hypothetical protein JCM8202v2_003519 [Rhodotorula sphaerocarpa]